MSAATVPSQASHTTREELLRCSHCRHLLGVRVGDDVVVLRQLAEGVGTTVGHVHAITCDRSFVTGKMCAGGWVDPDHADDLRALCLRLPEVGVAFAVMLAKAS